MMWKDHIVRGPVLIFLRMRETGSLCGKDTMMDGSCGSQGGIVMSLVNIGTWEVATGQYTLFNTVQCNSIPQELEPDKLSRTRTLLGGFRLAV